MKSSVADLIRQLYAAYVQRDRKRVDEILHEDFAFSSPRDNRIDKAAYFARCWDNGEKFASMELEQVFTDGDAGFVRYRAVPKPDAAFAPFRNVEFFRTENGQIKEVEVYFGRSLGDAKQAVKPSQTPAQRRLEPFVGDWALSGRQLEGPFGKAADISAHDHYEWLQGGKLLIHRFDGRLGDHPMACIEIIEPDSKGDGYRVHTFYDDGRVQQWQQTVQDNVWTLSGIWAAGDGETMNVRCTQSFEDNGATRRARWERSSDGLRWQTFWEVTASKDA